MNLRLLPLAIAFVVAACQRLPNPTPGELEAERRREEQIQALNEKIAQLQDLERQATERKLEEINRKAEDSEQRASLSEKERQRLEREKTTLLRERERLAAAQEKAERAAYDAERRAADAARRADHEQQERTMDLFYTALEPHGEWMEIDRYGYVWRPGEGSNPRWRPYTEGRWVFTDYGWTWKSNEPFGWATYHYGRWVRLRRIGWVWVPGTEWGPGWVSWRRSDRFIGWAPLPPEAWSRSGFNEAVDSYYEIGPGSYTFVPIEEIGEESYAGRAVEPERNVTIVKQTVNVTNIKYTNVQNNTVVFNGGPDLSNLNERAQQKIPQLKVERVADVRSMKDLGRAEQKGGTLVMAAPKIAEKQESERPARLREQTKTAEVERGWGGIDKAEASEARGQIADEARRAEERERKGGKRDQGSASVTGHSLSRDLPQTTVAPATKVEPIPESTTLPVPANVPKTAKPSPAVNNVPKSTPTGKLMVPDSPRSAGKEAKKDTPENPVRPVSSTAPSPAGEHRPGPNEPKAKRQQPGAEERSVPVPAQATPSNAENSKQNGEPLQSESQLIRRQRKDARRESNTNTAPLSGESLGSIPNSAAPAVPAKKEQADLAPAQPAPGTSTATPERRLPKAKRPRPTTPGTPTPTEAESPVETNR